MLGFNKGTMKLTQLVGFDKLVKSIDSYISGFAKSERKAPEQIEVSIADYEKMQEKAIAFHKREHKMEVEHVEIFHRDFQLIPIGGLENYGKF